MLLALLFFGTVVHGQNVQFTLDTSYHFSAEGHLRLEWTELRDVTYELQQALSPDFANPHVIYRGPDLASFISGLQNGLYYYRVRAEAGPWSDPLLVEVQHQSLTLALTLFSIGGIVFLLTVFVVVQGARKAKTTES